MKNPNQIRSKSSAGAAGRQAKREPRQNRRAAAGRNGDVHHGRARKSSQPGAKERRFVLSLSDAVWKRLQHAASAGGLSTYQFAERAVQESVEDFGGPPYSLDYAKKVVEAIARSKDFARYSAYTKEDLHDLLRSALDADDTGERTAVFAWLSRGFTIMELRRLLEENISAEDKLDQLRWWSDATTPDVSAICSVVRAIRFGEPLETDGTQK